MGTQAPSGWTDFERVLTNHAGLTLRLVARRRFIWSAEFILIDGKTVCVYQ
jgi:hypothetical protein